jgi:outer membrane lipoprotein SlyB
MTEKITLEQALELVSFIKRSGHDWKVLSVYGDVYGDVHGDVHGGVHGGVFGDVRGQIWGSVGAVLGDVHGGVLHGDIRGRRWESVETPQERLERLIQESGDQELIEAFKQQQENN